MRFRLPFHPLASAACGLLLAASASAGQLAATLSGPSLGYVWSGEEGKLRPLQGILGNALIGDPAELGFTISQALALPGLDGRHFLASREGSAALVSINLGAAPPSITGIEDAPAGPSMAAASSRGTAAALYYPAQQRVLIVTGLPSSPKVTQNIEVSVPLTRMAVSNDGALLVYAFSSGERYSLYRWTPSGSFALTTADDISDITLAENGNVIVADAKANEIFSILDSGGSATRYFLAGGRNGVSHPTGVAVSSANQILVANAGTGTIMTLDPTGRVLRTTACGCEVSGLYRLRDSIYRLSDRADRTIYLLEAGQSGDRVVFVPMLRAKK